MNIIEKTDNGEEVIKTSDCQAVSNEQISSNPKIESRQMDEVYQSGNFFLLRKSVFCKLLFKYVRIKLNIFSKTV